MRRLLLFNLLALLSLYSCSSSEDETVESPDIPELGTKADLSEYEEHPTTLVGRWHMVKVNDADNSIEILPNKSIITFLDNGYAVIDNAAQNNLLGSGNYPYQINGNRIAFDVGGIVGDEYYNYEIKENIMLLSNAFSGQRFCFLKVKHEGDFDDINYAELKYRHTYTDTLVIASHVFYDANDAPFYLIRSIHSNLGDWFEDHAEIEGFQHMEGYEVKAIVWTGYYGSGCVVESDQRLIKILDKQQKKSENIPDKYWKQTTPGWAD
jgi:hypothetical protein